MSWVELNWLHDGELLGRIGRSPLGAIVDILAPFLAEQGITLPDPSLPDTGYFAALAATFRSQPVKVLAYLPPFPTAGPRTQTRKPPPARVTAPQPSDQPPYALRRDGRLWHVRLDGKPAVLRHEQGLCYVAHLFASPGERVKNLLLATKYARLSRTRAGITEAWDDRKGETVCLGKQPVVQAAVSAADEEEARQRLHKMAQELNETINDRSMPETEKAHARQELDDIANYLSKDSRPSRDEHKQAADSVRTAIKHLLRTLLSRGEWGTSEEQVRREFAKHIAEHVGTPSRRYAAPKARKARGDLTGCLLYEPPLGISWVVRQ
jgi:hypothetical protein